MALVWRFLVECHGSPRFIWCAVSDLACERLRGHVYKEGLFRRQLGADQAPCRESLVDTDAHGSGRTPWCASHTRIPL